ncbi:S8 family peptidase [Ruminococcus sp. OA3]|uniref:S8 family peptidase n=1 Tax=Ruminococcus sp. OA3 TaxID=2914164 RepID=UPI001F061BF4|nr:S8 family peptidase [Ruminococcus sp. OA3]MCH1982452.1 S8 family peptidase [Ruminococcus sp. OA3]
MEKVIDENYYDLIINNTTGTAENTDKITFLNDRNSMLHVEVKNFSMCNLGQHSYFRFPTLYTLSSEFSLSSSGITRLQSNTLLSLFGRGVIVGVIDTGIDYTHPAFRFNDGTTRIISIWDQTLQDDKRPQGFNFGTEFSRDMINIALASGEPTSVVPTRDDNGHGTAIASIIAGSPDEENSFSGVVPESQLVVVKLKEAKQNLRKIMCVPENVLCYQETDLMLGIRYALNTAKALGKPLVICIAISSSMTGHEAEGATSSYINNLGQMSQVNISVAAGNEGNNRRHYYGNVTAAPFSEEFELKVSGKDPMFAFQIWPDLLARLSIQIISPNGESMPIVYPSISGCVEHRFILSSTTVWVNNILLEEENGTQMIMIRFNDTMEGIWRMRVINIDSNPFCYHCWLPSAEMISDDTYFLNSNPDTVITSPGNADYALTVGAYNQYNDSILLTSSRGYTRVGRVKPDIAAPGFEIPCAIPNNGYMTLTGTGAAAAHAAGAVAIIFEWAVVKGNYTSITGNDINTLVLRGASRKPSDSYPNNIWGYGKLDLYSLFELLTFI